MLTALRKTSLTDGFQDEINMKSNILQAVEISAGSSIYNITTETGEIDLADMTPTRLFIEFDVDNTGAAQMQINGRALAPLVSIDGEPLEGHDILPNVTYTVDYDGVSFLVNTESAETLSNVMRYDSIPPLPTGVNGLFTYEDFYNHYIPIGEATILANTGLKFPKYKVYPYNGNNVNITYGLLKWEADYTKQTVTFELDLPEIEQKYTIVKYLVISKNEDDPACRVVGSTEIVEADWNRLHKEVVQSAFYEGHYMVTLKKPNNLDFFIEKTDGVEFAVGTLIELKGQSFVNLSELVDQNDTSTMYHLMTVRPRRARFGRVHVRGSYTRVGKDGEPDKNKVINTYRYMSTWGDGSTEGDADFATGMPIGTADHDTQFSHTQMYMAAPNYMSVNTYMFGADPAYDVTTKQEMGITSASLSAILQDESGKLTAFRFVNENVSTYHDDVDMQFHITIKSPRKSDLDNLKIYY